MNNLYILIQQYLTTLSLNNHREKATEVLDKYATFLEKTQRIAEYTNISAIGDSTVICDDVIDFILKEEAASAKQKTLDRLTDFWAFAAQHQEWAKSPLAGLPESVPHNELERRLAILYLLQETAKTPAELAKQLLYKESTIMHDISNMRHSKDFGILIWESGMDTGQPKYQFTGHPYLIAYSLKQIGELLIDLRQAIQSAAPHSPAFSRLYHDLWFRLTPYGKDHMAGLGLPAPDRLSPASPSMLEEKALEYGCDIRLVQSLKAQSPIRLTLQRGTETEEDTALVLDLLLSQRRRSLKVRSTLTDQEYLVSLEDIVDIQFDQR